MNGYESHLESQAGSDTFYHRFADQLKCLVGFDRMTVNVVDPDSGMEKVTHYSGLPVPDNSIGPPDSAGASQTGHALSTGQTLVRDEISDGPHFQGDGQLLEIGIRSCIVVCLRHGVRIVGTLSLASTQPAAYGQRERTIIEHLAGHLALVVAQASSCWTLGEATPVNIALSRLTGALDGLNVGIISAEEQLRKLASAIEQSPNGVAITDSQAIVEYVNPKYTEISGYTPQDVLGSPVRIVGSEEYTTDEYRNMWQSIISSGNWRREFRRSTKAGDTYWASQSVFPILDPEGMITHCVVVEEDITQRKLLEEQLIQAQRMESVGRLASSVAHDLNNLLISMLGYGSLLQASLDHSSEGYEYAGLIGNLVEKAADLTRHLLTMARKDETEAKPIDLNLPVGDALRVLSDTFAKNSIIVPQLQPDLPLINADVGQVQQVVMNLCINALDAMPGGGLLVVSTKSVDLVMPVSDGQVSLPPGRYVEIAVSDSGVGISEEDQERIFEPFFTTKGPDEGTGLGLPVARGIVNNQGGVIQVSSNVGIGTVFTIYLPIYRRPESQPESHSYTEF